MSLDPPIPSETLVPAPLPDAGRRYRSIRSSNYDISNTCNLTCEGCYYFVSGQKTPNRRPTEATYDHFFASEAARGVNYPQFSGGEPSLNTRALRIAAKYWSAGIIYTNGVKRIPAELPFRIAVSVWGARARNDRLRGAGAYDQALSAAVGDRRALVYLTINRENVEDIPLVAADCAAKGVPLSFNDFSMTTEYIRLIAAGDTTSNPFVRTSTSDQNLSLSHKDRSRAADLIDAAMDRYPETVLYARVLNDFVHRSPAIFDIDPATGVATNCAYLGVEWHRGYDYDLRLLRGKRCCAPEFDCSDCRVGPAAAFTLLMRLAGQMRRSETARRDIHQLRDHMMHFYYWDWGVVQSLPVVSASAPVLSIA